MSIQYVEVAGFPNYEISSTGTVINKTTDRILTHSPNQFGEMTVGMMKDGVQRRRSVKVLVAEAFVDGHTRIFDTPVQLNHVKEDLNARNIVWRPRWFAWKYARQFTDTDGVWFEHPVVELLSEVEYSTIFHAAMIHGLLCRDIQMSCLNGSFVFPLNHTYRYVQ